MKYLPFVIIKYSNNQMLSESNLHKQVIFFFSFLNFSEQYNIFFKYRHYQTMVLVKKRNTNRKYQIKKARRRCRSDPDFL